MITAVVLISVLAIVIVVHEAGHALALRGLGFTIEEAGLGFPIGPRKVFPPTKRRPFALSLSMFLFAAYVKPRTEDAERIDNLPWRQHAWFMGAGVTANVILGLAALAAYHLVLTEWSTAAAFAVGALAAWFGRRLIGVYGFIAAGPLSLAAFLYISFNIYAGLWDGMSTGTASVSFDHVVGSQPVLVAFLGVLGKASLLLGMLNAAPIFPMDGSKVIDRALRRRGWSMRRILAIRSGLFAIVLTFDLVALVSLLWSSGVGLFT